MYETEEALCAKNPDKNATGKLVIFLQNSYCTDRKTHTVIRSVHVM